MNSGELAAAGAPIACGVVYLDLDPAFRALPEAAPHLRAACPNDDSAAPFTQKGGWAASVVVELSADRLIALNGKYAPRPRTNAHFASQGLRFRYELRWRATW